MEETFGKMGRGSEEAEERLRILNDTLMGCLTELSPTAEGKEVVFGVIQDSIMDCLNSSFATWTNKKKREEREELDMIKACFTNCLNTSLASLWNKVEEVLEGVINVSDSTNSSSLSLDPTDNEVLLRSPLRVASYMGVQVTLMTGVWASAGVVVATILHSSSTRDQYLYWYLLNLALATIISG